MYVCVPLPSCIHLPSLDLLYCFALSVDIWSAWNVCVCVCASAWYNIFLMCINDFILFLTDPATSLNCFCNRTGSPPNPPCVNNGFSCVSSTMCYTQQLISKSNGNVNWEWGCLEHLNPHPPVFTDEFCRINLPDNAYSCCNETDYCNNETLFLLRTESVSPTPSVLFTSAPSEWKSRPKIEVCSSSHWLRAVTIESSVRKWVWLSH